MFAGEENVKAEKARQLGTSEEERKMEIWGDFFATFSDRARFGRKVHPQFDGTHTASLSPRNMAMHQ